MHERRLFAAKFDRITDQILEQLAKLNGIALNSRQWVVSYSRLAVFDGDLQILESVLKNDLTVGRRKLSALGAYTGVSQQSLDQVLHSLGPVHRKTDEFFGLAIEFAFVAPRKQLHVACDHS